MLPAEGNDPFAINTLSLVNAHMAGAALLQTQKPGHVSYDAVTGFWPSPVGFPPKHQG